MPVPDVRIRKETFGYTLAFASGTIGFYREEAAGLLLRGTTEEELETCRLSEIPVGENFRLAGPLVAWIELTHACNLPCKHCYIEAGRPRRDEMDTTTILRLLDQMKEQGVFCVVFLGGEPMMHPDFTRIVRYAHDLGFVISIGTNGTLIDQAIIDELPKEECFVSVSLDGFTYQRTLRKKSTFEDLHERLMLLKRNHVPTGIMCVMTDENLDELHGVLDYAIEHGFYFGKTPFSPIGRGRHFPELAPRVERAPAAVALEVKDSAHEKRMLEETGLCFTGFFHQCYALSAAIRKEFCGIALVYVQADGEVFPCTTCSSTGKFRAGNVRRTSFAEIWENGFHEIRAISFDDYVGCGDCDIAKKNYFCTGRCPVMSEVHSGARFGCGSTPFLRESLRLAMEHQS